MKTAAEIADSVIEKLAANREMRELDFRNPELAARLRGQRFINNPNAIKRTPATPAPSAKPGLPTPQKVQLGANIPVRKAIAAPASPVKSPRELETNKMLEQWRRPHGNPTTMQSALQKQDRLTSVIQNPSIANKARQGYKGLLAGGENFLYRHPKVFGMVDSMAKSMVSHL